MKVKGLFSHFNDNTNVLIFENETAQQESIISWQGRVIDLRDGGKTTYNYCEVAEWYVNKDSVLEIIIK